MLNLSTAQRLGLLLALIAMIASTRMSHFGSANLLPDATLAMFLLGGVLLGSVPAFIVMLLAVFGLDIYAAQTTAAAAWCFTPAYAGLIPTYAVLWLTGMGLAQRQYYAQPLVALPVSITAVSLAFVVSNGFFFGLNGPAASISLSEFVQAVAPYFADYLASAMLYLIPALVTAALWRKSRLHMANAVPSHESP